MAPAAGGFYGWETLESQLSTQPSAYFTGTVPMAGIYRVTASGLGGSNRTLANVDVNSAAGGQRLQWDQRDGGVSRVGEVAMAGAFTVSIGSNAMSGVLSADAIALNYLRPLDGGIIVVDAGAPDAGVQDAGVQDAGVPDAGVQDAGVRDAGVVDAGVQDAGAATDAGEVDAGTTSDAGFIADAGSSSEAPVDAGSGSGVAGGCGCTGAPGSTSFLLAGLLFVLKARRRRSAH